MKRLTWLLFVLAIFASGTLTRQAEAHCDRQWKGMCCGVNACGHTSDSNWVAMCQTPDKSGRDFVERCCDEEKGLEVQLDEVEVKPAKLIVGEFGEISFVVDNTSDVDGVFGWKMDVVCNQGDSVHGAFVEHFIGAHETHGANEGLLIQFMPLAAGDCRVVASLRWSDNPNCGEHNRSLVREFSFWIVEKEPDPCTCTQKPCDPNLPCPPLPIDPCTYLDGPKVDRIWNCHMNTGRSMKACRGLRNWCDPRKHHKR